MEDDRPTAGRGDDEEHDDLPDWRQFARFAKSTARSADDLGGSTPFIPKRGEKDFEPVPSSSLLQSDNSATLSQYQNTLLNESRSALFTALGSGSRFHPSKSHNVFTWRADVDGGKATCDAGTHAFGIHFMTLGRYSPERKRLELLPEEALYMFERGAIELWSEREEGGELVRVAMTVQQAWAALIGHDELTVERFQIYAYLKRLGYTVIRARPRHPFEKPTTKTVVLPRRSILQLLRLTFNHIFYFASALRNLLVTRTPARVKLALTRTLKKGEGSFLALVSGRRWTSYDQIFGRLQIIPSGHDAPLPRPSTPRTANILTPLVPGTMPTSDLPSLETHPYQEFFHIYKPINKYRKSDPGPPDFRLVVISATTTTLPTVFEFASMFSSVPLPSEDTLLPPPRTGSAPPRKPRFTAPPPSLLRRLSSYLPFGPPHVPTPGPYKPSAYPRLKMGRRNVLVAVVDNGTSSFLRFSEAEFAKLPWRGVGRAD